MKMWQFSLLASFIYGAPRVNESMGVITQLTFLVAAVIFFATEWRKK